MRVGIAVGEGVVEDDRQAAAVAIRENLGHGQSQPCGHLFPCAAAEFFEGKAAGVCARSDNAEIGKAALVVGESKRHPRARSEHRGEVLFGLQPQWCCDLVRPLAAELPKAIPHQRDRLGAGGGGGVLAVGRLKCCGGGRPLLVKVLATEVLQRCGRDCSGVIGGLEFLIRIADRSLVAFDVGIDGGLVEIVEFLLGGFERENRGLVGLRRRRQGMPLGSQDHHTPAQASAV